MAKNFAQTGLLVLMSLAVLASAESEGTWLFSSSKKVTVATPAPMPADPCAEIVFNMMDCMDFLSLDQPTGNKPSASCCTGFDSVLAVSPLCVCAAVKTATEIGLVLNMTRAAQLPALCGAITFDTKICDANAAPGQEPMPPQGSSMTPPPSEKKAPAAATAAPTVSGSYSLNTVPAMFAGVAGVAGVLVSFYFA